MKMMRCDVMRCGANTRVGGSTKVYWQKRASNCNSKTLGKSNYSSTQFCRPSMVPTEPVPLPASDQKERNRERESTEHRPRHHFKSFSIRLRIPFVLHCQMLNYVWHNIQKYLASKLRAKVSH